MTVLRVHKTKDYTVMSNYHFKEKEMSLKAKGLLSLMLSLPDSWDYSIQGLVAICKENESAIVSTLTELKKFGFLEIKKLMPNQTKSGRIEYEYNIFEIPTRVEKQGVEKQDLEKLGVEFQDLEKQGQLSNKELSINKASNNKLNNNKSAGAPMVYFSNSTLNTLFTEFLEMRKKLKAVNSDRAIKMLINKLNKYDDSIKIKMLENSILNSWKDVYELKGTNKPNTTTGEFDGVAEAIRQRAAAEQKDEEFYKNLNF